MRYPSNRVSSYFLQEKKLLAAETVTGIIYNVGMAAGPYFEGQMVQTLSDILAGIAKPGKLLLLAAVYAVVIAIVQGMRFLKRLYVRKFANRTSLRMKKTIYRNILAMRPADREKEDAGTLMTKAISDADACAEGMRKVTTEIFDTGVVMIVYIAMLFAYDVRMTLIVILFPPVAYFFADRLKGVVTERIAAARESAGRLNASSLELVAGSLLYRVFGLESVRRQSYEGDLQDYETKQILGNIWESAMPPVYQVISMIGAIPILWLGSRNVAGTGWTVWNIAAFSTYLACYSRLALKASKSAKLFNSFQKAQVSWKRVKPRLLDLPEPEEGKETSAGVVKAEKLSWSYPEKKPTFEDVNFAVKPGQILAVTGPVGCGKSTLGRMFLAEEDYGGSLTLDGRELKGLWKAGESPVGYLGHQPELISGSVKDNICMGTPGDITEVLKCVCLYDEVQEMPDGENTRIGESGIRLSGGQQARLALARTLYHKRGIYVLDDPFSALDRNTEIEIFHNLKDVTKNAVVILISHRLTLFPQTDEVLWIEDGHVIAGTHEEILARSQGYRERYELQKEVCDEE